MADEQGPDPESKLQPGTITHLLREAQDGNTDALGMVWAHCYEDLRLMAHKMIQGDALGRQIDATELVGEIWMRGQNDHDLPRDRNEWFGRRFRQMSQHLIYLSRLRDASKRGGGWRQRSLEVVVGELAQIKDFDEDRRAEASELMEHWQELHQKDPTSGNIAFCRLVLGMSNAHTAETLGLDPMKTKQGWDYTKTRLRRAMTKRIDESDQ